MLRAIYRKIKTEKERRRRTNHSGCQSTEVKMARTSRTIE